jgi:predicted amidohydrolase
LVSFPECSLTPFVFSFYGPSSRGVIDEEQRWSSKVDAYFEQAMPNPSVQPLFDRAKALGIGFALGYAEQDGDAHYNSYILVGKDGQIIGNYRKSHIGGTVEPDPTRSHQYFEKRYFLFGDTGFPVWSAFNGQLGAMICYDRRWPESFRALGLRGAELVFVPFATGGSSRLADFHHLLCIQSGAYCNGYWIVSSSHSGVEMGAQLMGCSAIISPMGEIVARSYSFQDELIEATIDLDVAKARRAAIAWKDRRLDLYES